MHAIHTARGDGLFKFLFVNFTILTAVGRFFFSFSWARFAPMATLQLLTIEYLYSSFGFKGI